MGIPKLARLLIFSTLIITIPTLYLLYPHRETIIQTTQGYLEKGGIDSSHWRDPLPPDIPDLGNGGQKYETEEVRDWEDGLPGGGGQDVLDKDPIAIKEDHVLVEGSAMEHVEDLEVGLDSVPVEKGVLDGGVIMPKLENATAK